MARVKGGMSARRKHNKVLKLAKGYRGAIRKMQWNLIICIPISLQTSGR